MGKIRDLIHQIEMASPSELGKLVEDVNGKAFQDNDWNQVSVKASYALLLAELDNVWGQIKMSYDFGNIESKCVDCITGKTYSFNNFQAIFYISCIIFLTICSKMLAICAFSPTTTS